MVDDRSGIPNNMPTALAEAIFADIDQLVNDLSPRAYISPEDWDYAAELLAFLVCNYGVNRNLSNGDVSMLLNSMHNLHEEHPDLKPLDRYFYDGVTEESALKYFSGLAPTLFLRYDGLNTAMFHLNAATEILEEYWSYDDTNDPSSVTGPADLLAAYELLNHAHNLVQRVRDRERNKENING
jgi:hypothetical protein